jgi:hypothetical protein
MRDTPAIVWFVGFVRWYERGCLGKIGRRRIRDVALEMLKAWSEVGTVKTPGPSDVAEERSVPAVLSGSRISKCKTFVTSHDISTLMLVTTAVK